MGITVLVADDHPIVRRGVIQVFEEDEELDVVGECEDGEAALEAIQKSVPDVAIVDLRMPRLDGMEVLRRLHRSGSTTRVILLTGNLTDSDVVEAMKLGVKGIVLKEMAPKLLVQCVKKVAAGGVWIEKDAVSRAMEKLLQEEAKGAVIRETLTRREVEIVQMLTTGLSNREIADKLFISEGTVKSHLHTIYEKLGLKSRLQLAAWARENGIE
ncbi:MAG TPA: response regulator transcription factor [Thermoanaerobaculia bacterium]|nr:response regulator transcription factor [Thermoanaerobaculia bacterium]